VDYLFQLAVEVNIAQLGVDPIKGDRNLVEVLFFNNHREALPDIATSASNGLSEVLVPLLLVIV
jgi:hypothetical protein